MPGEYCPKHRDGVISKFKPWGVISRFATPALSRRTYVHILESVVVEAGVWGSICAWAATGLPRHSVARLGLLESGPCSANLLAARGVTTIRCGFPARAMCRNSRGVLQPPQTTDSIVIARCDNFRHRCDNLRQTTHSIIIARCDNLTRDGSFGILAADTATFPRRTVLGLCRRPPDRPLLAVRVTGWILGR